MIYLFDNFSLDTDKLTLKQDSKPLAMEPQVFEVIAALVSRHEQLVTKQDLIDLVWGGRFVSDGALSSRIKTARQLLNDDGKQQRLIRTVHGRGFRFVGEVRSAESTPETRTADSIASQPSVAVLPFENLSNDPDQGYLANALTQDISNILSRHRWLKVLSVNALRAFLEQPDLYQALGREAGVDYVVEGSVRRAGDRLRVVATLVSTERGQTHWSENYDRALADVFNLQDEISNTIVARLEPEIGFAERQRISTQRPARDLQAWECFHLGVDQFFRFTAAANREAQKLLQRSRTLDPAFAEAHAWWAYSVVLGMVYWDTEASDSALDEALAAAESAVQADSKNAVLYALMARVRLARGEYAAAIRENQRAVELNPALASAHCGLADSLAYEGRLDESIATFEHVIALSTNDPQRWAFFTYGAMAMIFAGDYERAIAWCDEALQLPNRQYWTLAHKVVALALLGREAEAHDTRTQLLQENPEFSRSFVQRKLFYLKRQDQLELYFRGLEQAGVA